MSLDQQITIKVAETEDEMRAAYRLRYQVFTEELSEERYADYELKEYKDSDDVEGSILFVAVESGEVVGSFRLKPLRNREFIGVEAYGIPQLAQQLNIPLESFRQTVAAVDRLVLAKVHRGQSLFRDLYVFVEAFAIKMGIETLVAAAESKRAVVLYTRSLGCKKYPFVGTHNGTTCQCIYKVLK